jgi:hypothetical protein
MAEKKRVHYGTEVPMCRAYGSKRMVTNHLALVTCKVCITEVTKISARVRRSRDTFYAEMDHYNDTRKD